MFLYLIITIVITIPAWFGIREMMRYRTKKRKRLILVGAYDRLVHENKLSAGYIDIMKNKVIAIDRKNKKLLLINHNKTTTQELCISLQQVTSGCIIEQRNEQDQSIKKIYLELQLKRNFIKHLFCFYDAEIDTFMELPSLSRKALHWCNRVNIYRRPGHVSIEQEYIQ